MPPVAAKTFRFVTKAPCCADSELMYLSAWCNMIGGTTQVVRLSDGMLTQDDLERDLGPFYKIVQTQLARFPTPRDAQIATGTIAWLGSPRGKIFLDNAERLATRVQDMYDRPRAYKMVWANEHDPYLMSPGTPADSIVADPRHRADDEMMRTVVGWLGMPAGQKFIAYAEQQIKLYHGIAERLARPVHHGHVSFIPPMPTRELPVL